MLGPEEAKKLMYGSDHASKAIVNTEAIHVSNIDAQTFDGATEEAEQKREVMS